jgi:hypothetical protein
MIDRLTISHYATVKQWLTQCDDLFVNIHQPHNCGPGDDYFIETLADLRQLHEAASPGAIIVVLRELQFPFRGIIDDRLIGDVLQHFREGQYWTIAGISRYPEPISTFGGGDTRRVFEEDLNGCRGMDARIDCEPSYPNVWTNYFSTDDWLFIENARNA